MDKSKAQAMINDTDKFAGWCAGILTADQIIAMPGVWEIVSEECNNDWIDHCESLIDE